jgi:hypothetical protein
MIERRAFLAAMAGSLLAGTRADAQLTAGQRESIYKNSWAVLIGIDKYAHPNIPKLRYAVNDVWAVERALLEQGFSADRIVKLTDAGATKAKIEEMLGDQLRQRVTPQDRILVFFAGHGKTDTLRSGEEEGFLLAVDSDPGRLFSTAISMSAVRQISDRLPAKHILYIVDACYSGYAIYNRVATSTLLEEMGRQPAIQILTAGRKQDEAQERSGHGIFTEVLVRGLQGAAFGDKNWLALEELGLWVKQRVFAESNRLQLPQYGNLSGEGQFVFMRAETRRVLQHIALREVYRNLGISLPPDAEITPPDPSVSSAAAAFSGQWVGTWTNGVNHALVIEKVSSEYARVIYAVSDHPAQLYKRHFVRAEGTFERDGGTLTLAFPRAAKVTYTMRQDGKMDALYKRPDDSQSAVMARLEETG